MDPSLLRERELFKKRALSTPAVEKRPAPSSDSSSSKKKKAKVEQGGSSSSKQSTDHSNGSFNLKALSGGSGYKFGVLAKIVNYMKTRHQRGDTHALTLDEILDETQHLDIGLKQKQWLMSEALVNNPKIEVVDGKYAFKPKYNLKDKKALLRLLDKHDQRGLGGILLEDIEEGLPNAQKAIKALGDQIIFVNRPDKKKILFYNDKSCQFTVDEGIHESEPLPHACLKQDNFLLQASPWYQTPCAEKRQDIFKRDSVDGNCPQEQPSVTVCSSDTSAHHSIFLSVFSPLQTQAQPATSSCLANHKHGHRVHFLQVVTPLGTWSISRGQE